MPLKHDNTPRFLIVHCSASKDRGVLDTQNLIRYHESWRFKGNIISEAEGLELLRQGKKGVERPWLGGGYHYYLDTVGDRIMVLKGRPWFQHGVHCRGDRMNWRSLGVCVVGDYDLKAPPPETLERTANLCAELSLLFKIPVQNIHGHRDHATDGRTCPGLRFELEPLRTRVGELLGNKSPVPPRDSTQRNPD